MSSGTDRQRTERIGEILVQAALETQGFVTGLLDPDLGEDLWIEVDGFAAAATGAFPLRAMLQIKSSDNVGGPVFTIDLSTKHIRRWAAHPQPLFLVGVATKDPRRFYAKSIDSIIREDLNGQDVMCLASATARVHLPAVENLSAFLRTHIDDHYKSSQLVLAGLTDDEIEHDSYEIRDRKHPEAWERPPIASWKVLWKSPNRQQHFAALLTDLAHRAQAEYRGTSPRPAFVVFHIYRSLSDLHNNLATVRVDWVDPEHPKAPEIVGILGAPGGFRLRVDKDVKATRAFIRSRTASPADFLAFAQQAGIAFDRISEALIEDSSPDAWTVALRDLFQEAENLWDSGPFAPVEHVDLDKVLTAHHGALFDHYFVSLHRRDKLPPSTVSRLLDEAVSRMRSCCGAWRIFVSRT